MNKKPDIKIFISCHKPSKFVDNKILYPVQVGTALTEKRLEGVLFDNTGDNISTKNKRYCELTAQYWAWKNMTADYYGFFHYRRYLNFSNKNFIHKPFMEVEMKEINDENVKKFCLDEQSMTELIEKYDIVIPKRRYGVCAYLHYKVAKYHHIKDLKFCLDIIKNDYPQMYKTAKKYMRSPWEYFCNMFIMKKEIFDDYNKWLFDILFKHEKHFDCKDYNTQEYRVSGYLAERLCGVYISWLINEKKVSYKKLQMLKIINTNL